MSVTREHSVISRILHKEMMDLLAQDRRIDGRSLSEFRKIEFEMGLLKKAEGSALVTLGGTKVLVGTKVEVGTPFPDTPDQGVLTVNAELLPLASPSFEPGPPDERSIALARYVDRSIRESKAIDLAALALQPGKVVYVVYIDVYVLDYNGNMTDTAVLAAVKALENTNLKKFNLEGEVPVFSGEIMPLTLKDYPVSTTFGIVGEKCFLDPNLEEEQASEGFTSFTYTRDGNLCAVMKNDQGYLSPPQIFEMLETGWEKAREIGRIMNWRSD